MILKKVLLLRENHTRWNDSSTPLPKTQPKSSIKEIESAIDLQSMEQKINSILLHLSQNRVILLNTILIVKFDL
jgi:hypothetical protein